MNVFIVFAHPEPKSFNGAMKDLAVRVLSEEGHQIRVSDLYAMRFNPVAGPGDVLERISREWFDLLAERREAYKRGAIAPDQHRRRRIGTPGLAGYRAYQVSRLTEPHASACAMPLYASML